MTYEHVLSLIERAEPIVAVDFPKGTRQWAVADFGAGEAVYEIEVVFSIPRATGVGIAPVIRGELRRSLVQFIDATELAFAIEEA